MGILARWRARRDAEEADFRSWAARRIKASTSDYFAGAITTWQEGRRARPDDTASLVARNKGWVYTCVARNASGLARLPLRLYVAKRSRGTVRNFPTRAVPATRLDYLRTEAALQGQTAGAVEIEEILEHPLLDLLAQVNPIQNKFDFLELGQTFLDLTGNWCVLKVRDEMGMLNQLWTLPSQWVSPIADRKRGIGAYEFGNDPATKKTFAPEDVVHVLYPNPQHPIWGLAPLKAGIDDADLNQAQKDFQSATYDNWGVPPAVYIAEGVLGQKAIKQLRREWKRIYGGSKNAGKIAFLDGGGKIEQLGLSPADLRIDESARYSKEGIAATFAVPMSMLETRDVNKANAEAGERSHARDAILPRARRIEEKLNEQLTAEFDERLFLAFDNPVAEDRLVRMQEIRARLAAGYSTPNEERQVDGWEPREGGDEAKPAGGGAPGGGGMPFGQSGIDAATVRELRRLYAVKRAGEVRVAAGFPAGHQDGIHQH